MAFVVNFLAIMLYGGSHSLLASRTMKAWIRGRLGGSSDRYYRAGFNGIVTVLFLPVMAILLWEHGDLLYAWPVPWLYMALIGQAIVVGLFVLAGLQTHPMSFLGIAQLFGRKDAGDLRTTGFYAWVRHPLYTLGLILLWLLPVMSTGLLGFACGTTLYILIGSTLEEKRLEAEFGDAYRQYQRRVAKLIPFIY